MLFGAVRGSPKHFGASRLEVLNVVIHGLVILTSFNLRGIRCLTILTAKSKLHRLGLHSMACQVSCLCSTFHRNGDKTERRMLG